MGEPTKAEVDAIPPEEPKRYRLEVRVDPTTLTGRVVLVLDDTKPDETARVLRFCVRCQTGEAFYLAIPEG